MKLGKLTLAITLATSLLMAANNTKNIDEDSIGFIDTSFFILSTPFTKLSPSSLSFGLKLI